MPSTEMILTILVTVIAVAGLFQLIILFVMFLAMRKGMKLAGEYATDIQSQVVPVLEHSKALIKSTRELIVKLEPKLDSTATDLANIAHIASAEAKRMQESADEITDRIRRQAERVDGLTTEALDTVERVGQFVNHAIEVPLRQISGILAAARAIFETLGKSSSRARARARN